MEITVVEADSPYSSTFDTAFTLFYKECENYKDKTYTVGPNGAANRKVTYGLGCYTTLKEVIIRPTSCGHSHNRC
jgi:hypothetical protein